MHMDLLLAFKFEDKGYLWGTNGNSKPLASNNITNFAKDSN